MSVPLTPEEIEHYFRKAVGGASDDRYAEALIKEHGSMDNAKRVVAEIIARSERANRDYLEG